jgi:hypothetical protein
VAVDEASVDPDPMTQLSQWLEVARTAGEPMPEAMAVATATTDGRPSSRMVLLRGIDHRGLVFYTDRESDKGRELRANPFAAASSTRDLPARSAKDSPVGGSRANGSFKKIGNCTLRRNSGVTSAVAKCSGLTARCGSHYPQRPRCRH